jgi:hypothetical protein
MNGDAKQPGEQNGWRFDPNAPDPQPVAPVAPTTLAPQPQQAPQDAVQSQGVQAPVVDPVSSDVAYDDGDEGPTEALALPEQHPEVSWTAIEFVAHHKSPLWYLALIIATLALASFVLFLSHDKVSTVLIIIIGVIAGYAAGRKPRSLQYLLDAKGITVNRAFRAYGEFKSFAIVQEGELSSIIFMPLKRFTLPLSLSVGSADIDNVITKLSDYLPNDQTHGHDAFDKFAQRVRF